MVAYRDITLRRQAREARKQDKLPFKRAVLVDEFGNQTSTSPLDDVWASETERRVWYMHEGAVQPAQVLCRKVSDPYVGLGVIIGYADGSNQLEVLSDDFFLTGTGDPTGWASTAPRDFEPGGLKQMWVYSKVITPLATYPGTGLAVNVISGDYPYLGTRKSYAGSVNFALTQNPNAGEHYLAGLYLDSANTLQVVYGASVVVATDPPEPSWPAGAFRLSAVRVNDTQTSIDFADDVFDRRMAWSDEQAGASWPFTNIWTVSTTDPDADYATIQSAIDAVGVTPVGILLDGGTFTETVTFDAFAYLKGFDQGISVISGKMTASVGGYLEKLTISVSSAEAIELTGFEGIIRECRFIATTGAGLKAVWDKIGYDLYDVTAQAAGGSGNQYGYYFQPAAPATTQIFGGLYRGDTADIYADTNAIIILQGPVLYNKTIAGAGTVQGYYYDTSGNLYFVDTTGHNSGVWQIDESATLKIKRATLAAAITAAASGDTIKLDTDTYSVSASQNIGVSVTIEGDGPEATIYTTSVSNAPIFDITADSITVVFRNLTLRHTGGGVAATGIFSNNASVTVVLDNCVLEITSGAGTDSRGLWIESGTWILRNSSKITVTSGTNKYAIYNDSAAATITIGAGCEVGGATADIYGDQASSVITLNSAILTNGLVSWAGVINWEPENKISKNLLYSSMTHNIWQDGLTLADLADDTYGPDTLWNVLNKDNAPDISGQAGGATDPFSISFRCTFDSNTAQAGIVQFLAAADTYPLRGQTVSLSADLWGTNITTLRMAVIVWTSTADTITSDVVGTWAAGNPTLATNWAYIGTPAAITITSTRARYAVNNLLVPTGANNIGVFIWTDAEESSGDLWEVARVQLERGPAATEFVARAVSEELLRINRFYAKSYDLGTTVGSITFVGSVFAQTRKAIAATTAGTLEFGDHFPGAMRTTPTITLYSSSTGTSGAVRNATAGTDRTGSTASNAGAKGFVRIAVDNTSANAIALDDIISFHWTANARL